MSGSFKNKETRVSCYKSVFIETAAWIDMGNNNDLVLNDYRSKLAKWLILFSFQKQTTLIMLTWHDWGQRERNIDNYYIKITQMTVFFNVLVSFFSGSILMYVSQGICYFIDQFTWLTELDEQWGNIDIVFFDERLHSGDFEQIFKIGKTLEWPFHLASWQLFPHSASFWFCCNKTFFSVRMALWWWIGSFGLKHIFYF